MSLSGKGRRNKGLVGEREVRNAFQVGGFSVRGLEGSGDHLVVCSPRLTLHIEAKRQETIRIADWSKQAEAEAPQGVIPIVAYRRSREPWRVSMRLDDFVAMLLATPASDAEDGCFFNRAGSTDAPCSRCGASAFDWRKRCVISHG